MNFAAVRFNELDKWSIPKTLRSITTLPTGWRWAKIESLVSQITDKVKVEKDAEYKMIGVKWYAEGTFHRETVKGNSISATYLTPVKAGAFIYNRLFAWKYSFAVVPDEHDGFFVSNEFPQFIVDETQIFAEYLYLIFRLEKTIQVVLSASVGSAAVSRNRFKEDEFLNLEIPLPPLNVQQDIIDRWQISRSKIYDIEVEIARLQESIDTDLLNFIGVHINDEKQTKKIYKTQYYELSRWDMEYVKNLGKSFESEKYQNKKIEDVILPLKNSTKRVTPKTQKQGKINYIGLENVESVTGRLVEFSPTDSVDIKSSCVVFSRDHILYAKLRPYLRKAIIPSHHGIDDGVASSEFLAIKPTSFILQDYLAEILRSSLIAEQAKMAIGARMPRISVNQFLSFSLPLPPMEKQKEIVLKISNIKSNISKQYKWVERSKKAIEEEIEALVLGSKKL